MKALYTQSVFLLLLLLLRGPCGPSVARAQTHDPIKWQFSQTPLSDSEVRLAFTASLEQGWHIYSQFIEEGGPLPTTFTFTPSDNYSLDGPVTEESTPVKIYDQTFMMDIIWYGNTVVFAQKVKLHVPATTVKGKIEFMVCTDEMCLPPTDIAFSFDVTAAKPVKRQDARHNKRTDTQLKKENDVTPAVPSKAETGRNNNRKGSSTDTTVKLSPPVVAPAGEGLDKSQEVAVAEPEKKTIPEQELQGGARLAEVASLPVAAKATDERVSEAVEPPLKGRSFWSIFVAGLLGGLAAIIMPCIFPMLPFTISYFMKQGGSGRRTVGIALLYGLSIIVIYVAVGLLVTVLFGSDALNSLATDGILNFLFFVLLVVFAVSLLGAFEITLPHAWVNKVNGLGDRKGLSGIFFMAATLALVSFSCTGPIIGTLLVETSGDGLILFGPAVGMFGFSLALALPFTLFAMFPSWLKALPKSGGWLNSVKVVLGFLELALALKFLSNVDLAYHWNWFDREVFLVMWIMIFGIMGLYLLGKVKLPHDEAAAHVSPLRLIVAIITLAFTLYMVPGLWGAPLRAVAAFLPPQQTQDFDLYTTTLGRGALVTQASMPGKKYDDIFHAPYNIGAFFDYEEGIAYARKVRKPVMIDFTGHACVNCRKMEANIWSHPEVLTKLQQDYVLIQLYVDDKTALPEAEQGVSGASGKFIKTLGNKWSDLQASVFKTNSQPYYVLLGHDEKPLVPGKGADYDVMAFANFLHEGLEVFRGEGGNRKSRQ